MKTAQEIISYFDGELAQLVICDGAPDGKKLKISHNLSFTVTGLHAFDEYLQSQLVFSVEFNIICYLFGKQAFNITSCILSRGGTFVSKVS